MSVPAIPSLFKQLWFQILVAMVLGVVSVLIFGEAAADKVSWMGTLFVRLLKMVIVPLVLTSIISGVASVGGGGKLGRLGLKTFSWYALTSLLAILVGLVLVNVLRPGIHADADFGRIGVSPLPELSTPGSLAEIFFRMVPTNPIAAMAGGDMLAIIFFAILVGASINAVGGVHQERLSGLFDSAFAAMMVLTGWVIALAPLGVFGLIATAMASSGAGAFRSLALYMFTIALGLLIHLLLVLPLLLWTFGRMNPITHYRNMSEAMLMAFSTSSSSATLPVTMRCVEQKVGVSNRTSSFVLPMGATINMDGTALYECVGVIFIAQVLGYELGMAAQFTVVLTALLASVGAAGIPSAGLVMIFIVTDAVGLTEPAVAVIVGAMLAIDRPLDMMRTMVNITSDSCGAAVVARSEGEENINGTVRA